MCKKPYVKGITPYPCGQCLPCRLNRRRLWTHRLLLEQRCHEFSSFATLSYSDDTIPVDGSLNPKHSQDWLKRLRFALGSARPLRYYLIGEYGDETFRPHYHAALFGLSHLEGDLLRETWGFGHTLLGTLTKESAQYICGYVTKKMTSHEDPRLGGRHPEFARMSRRPAIGKRWFDRFSRDVFPHDSFVVRDFPSKPPRYFFDLYRRLDPALAQYVRDERAKEAISRFEDSTPRRLSEREKVKLSAINPLTRPLD